MKGGAGIFSTGGGSTPSGSAQWQPNVIAGIAQTTVANLGTSKVASGVTVQQSTTSLINNETPGIALTGIYNGGANEPQSAGIAQTTVANLGTSPQASGAQIVQITYGLAGDYGATTDTISPTSGNGIWTNPANALGKHDGTNATVAGQTLNAVDSILTLGYAALSNKTALTITQVQLVFYVTFTKSATGSPSMALRYSLNGGTSYTTLQTLTASNAGPSLAYDITSAVGGNWANLANVKTQLEFIAALADVLSSATCDAVELVVTANATQAA